MNRILLGFVLAILNAGIFARAASVDADFGATDAIVGVEKDGLETPVNQMVTPAGKFVELPGVRPNALALSPDGHLLVTTGLTNTLLMVDPEGGAILQTVKFPASTKTAVVNAVSPVILGADKKAKLSYTGLVFSPDGSRIYLANVNGDIKVFGVGADHQVSALSS
ncbi:MAG TPA: hypothetical protein VNZ25_01130, partial [Candidatus Angelobacter sp.]|nr:hypothetical protein [Candidatus Angelobacter sp.]